MYAEWHASWRKPLATAKRKKKTTENQIWNTAQETEKLLEMFCGEDWFFHLWALRQYWYVMRWNQITRGVLWYKNGFLFYTKCGRITNTFLLVHRAFFWLCGCTATVAYLVGNSNKTHITQGAGNLISKLAVPKFIRELGRVRASFKF